MTTEDLKGNLLARRANIGQAIERLTAGVLLAEERLRDARAELAGAQGQAVEVQKTLALLEAPAPA